MHSIAFMYTSGMGVSVAYLLVDPKVAKFGNQKITFVNAFFFFIKSPSIPLN